MEYQHNGSLLRGVLWGLVLVTPMWIGIIEGVIHLKFLF